MSADTVESRRLSGVNSGIDRGGLSGIIQTGLCAVQDKFKNKAGRISGQRPNGIRKKTSGAVIS